MGLTERQRIAAKKAKLLMDPDDYDALAESPLAQGRGLKQYPSRVFSLYSCRPSRRGVD